ncbi:dihydroorotase [Candidatus Poribacteria bacterium]|nr:dihydroorotase [Candidatus Poribacteria bacterium]MBT5532734.1 dihydroorotase [Candidatus Poribacteria bacterium]MBT5714320.1 dihydroorotase [Candidatus Poribacteria bacterium]MBT7095759.1 dihydroorotase [Candidatus Poribacteria bacterium]MBT7809589.1 dihydroorotase [Candidatus Poribacteria bacterium]
MSLLIRDGRILCAHTATDRKADLRVQDGHITDIADRLEPSAGENVVSAAGRIVAPGLIDMHVHLRDPGQTHKEDVESGTRAAASGGFVAVACMANTAPTLDDPKWIAHVLTEAETKGSARVHPIGSITLGLEGREPSPYEALHAVGAVGFSDDGKSTMDDDIMRSVLRYGARHDAPVFVHCEDPDIAGDGVMHEGDVSTALELPGIPPEAEERIIVRDCVLAEETGGHVHIQHVTTRRGVEIIRAAKGGGAPVTAEGCPHHFTLTHEAVRQHGADAKMNPPLRTEDDVRGIIEGLADGTLDAIATDHAPHSAEEKGQGMRTAPFGITGSELCVPLTWTSLVRPGHLSDADAVRKLTTVPSEILRLPAPRIEVGGPADITVIDPAMRIRVTVDHLHSKSHNTPFLGTSLTGWPVLTICGGRETFRRRSHA